MLLDNYYFYFPSVLSPQFCDDVLAFGKTQQIHTGVTHIGDEQTGLMKSDYTKLNEEEKEHVGKKRQSNIAWLNEPWIYREIHPYIEEANRLANWNFEWDFTEVAQFTKYEVGQFYGWHADGHPKPYSIKEKDANYHNKIRKLSVTVALNEENEYEGGELEFDYRNTKDFDVNPGSSVRTCNEIKPKGSIVVFPSFVWHRVKPVTKGTRYSLVMWNLGYPFR